MEIKLDPCLPFLFVMIAFGVVTIIVGLAHHWMVAGRHFYYHHPMVVDYASDYNGGVVYYECDCGEKFSVLYD